MQNKTIHDVNFILNLLKNRPDFYDILFYCDGVKNPVVFVDSFGTQAHQLDFLYKTTWLLNFRENGPCSFGVIADGRVIFHQENECEMYYFCKAIQDIPAQVILSFYYFDNTSLKTDKILQGMWKRLLSFFTEYVGICRKEGLDLDPICESLLKSDFSVAENNNIECISSPTGESPYLDYGKIELWDNLARKGQRYFPNVQRELFKPVTKLYTPRIVPPEECYLDVGLVEHMIDGDDTSLDQRYIQA